MSNYANTFAGRKITQKFSASGHAAIDFRAAEGEAIPSPVTGTVVEVGSGSSSRFGPLGFNYGKFVVVRDLAGREHFFAHLSDNSVVREGDSVTVGQSVGLVGHTGGPGVTGPHIHWGVFVTFPVRSSRVDPVAYITAMVGSVLASSPPVQRSDADTVRRVSRWLQGRLPGYRSAATTTGIRGYYYWIMVQRYGRNNGLYSGPVNGIPGVNSRRVEAYVASVA